MCQDIKKEDKVIMVGSRIDPRKTIKTVDFQDVDLEKLLGLPVTHVSQPLKNTPVVENTTNDVITRRQPYIAHQDLAYEDDAVFDDKNVDSSDSYGLSGVGEGKIVEDASVDDDSRQKIRRQSVKRSYDKLQFDR